MPTFWLPYTSHLLRDDDPHRIAINRLPLIIDQPRRNGMPAELQLPERPRGRGGELADGLVVHEKR